MSDRQSIIDANIAVHTTLAKVYDETEPQFRPENVRKVAGYLEELSRRTGAGRLLDMGCGTGFVVRIADPFFREICGVDVTQAMLDRVPATQHAKVEIRRASADDTPYESGSFDAVSAYSFLHHTGDYRPFLKEAHRVLRPGGVMYVDLEPNRAFWAMMRSLEPAEVVSSPILAKAKHSVEKVDQDIEKQYSIPSEQFRTAEYIKAQLGGIEAAEFEADALALGFSKVEVRYDWYVGQAEVMHGQSFEAAETVESYLRSILPATKGFFKYLQFFLVK